MKPFDLYDKKPLRPKVYRRVIGEIAIAIGVALAIFGVGRVVYWTASLVLK